MAISRTAVISALEDLATENTKTFDLSHPFFDRIIDGGNLEKIEGNYQTFVVTPDGPGTGQVLRRGDELLVGGFRENSQKGSEFLGQAAYSFDVADKEIRRLGGKMDLVKLLAEKPELAIMDFKEQLARWFLQGTNGYDVFVTLNGEQTYDPEGLGSRFGVFEAAAKNSQSQLTHGIAKNTVKNWHHQYGHIGSFRSEGTQVMRSVFYAAMQQGASLSGSGITDIYCDQETFENYIKFMDDRVIANDKPQPDRTPKNPRTGVKFLETGATIYPEPYIDLSEMTGSATSEGVAYFLDPSTWRFFTAVGSYDGVNLNEGWFDKQGPQWVIDQLVYRTVYTVTMNGYCFDLRKNGFVTGGANA